MSNLGESRKIRPTKNSDIALKILTSKGLNASLFIREAIEEKLYKDYRSILKKAEKVEIEDVPSWLYD